MLRDVGIGARHEDRPARPVGAARPHLLAVHDPLVAVAHRHRGEPGEVGTGARLAEELAPALLTGEDRRQEPRLLLMGTDRIDRGRGLVHADEIARARCGCAEGRSRASTTCCHDAATPNPPNPGSKCTHPSPASYRARRNRLRSAIAGSGKRASNSSIASTTRASSVEFGTRGSAMANSYSVNLFRGYRRATRHGGGSNRGRTGARAMRRHCLGPKGRRDEPHDLRGTAGDRDGRRQHRCVDGRHAARRQRRPRAQGGAARGRPPAG